MGFNPWLEVEAPKEQQSSRTEPNFSNILIL